ncbi:M28 family peptidase [Rhizobium jaguaris]|uniref:M28 family peptidase n=1 Tax=Rhizobium jaguaris TaxID=1312183 RepID=A0A387FX28_9HYPH|nr:M28 family peptidase [Rhizobium jaguaris]AYG63219.1 M28 family peptidase [Rhizobium jaguaris]
MPDATGLQPDYNRLMAHIREFSRRVKLSGTPEELESFHYLQAEMGAYGYHTRLLSHDAFISLPGKARVEIDGEALRCITHSMSISTPAGGIDAELVHVGEGHEADFSGRNVHGKIVLVDGIATEEVAALASAAGAIGQIHISPNEHLYEMCVSPVWGSPSQHTRNRLPTTAICTITLQNGEPLRKRLADGETIRASIETEVDTGWRKTPILVAELGPDGAEDVPFVLFSGHHDTWHFGVMDNGGANATMLEAARVLAIGRREWKRGLRICFWSGHSHGRYSGSAWYADEYFDELDRRCVAHVNVDSTGGEGATVLTNSGVIDELRSVAAEAIEAVSGQKHAGRRHGRAADQSFWGVGIPSMFGSLSHQPPSPVKMLTALGWWWHTPHDTVEHIDPDNLVRDTRIILLVLHRLLTAQVLPLDYAVYARSLGDELARLDKDLSGQLDIGTLRTSAADLEQWATTLMQRSAGATEAAAERINAALMRASRLLVPLNYTSGERFHPDSALPHTPWPSLDGIRELARLPAHSEDTAFYTVHARQTRNRIAHALREANAVLKGALD